MIINLAYLLVGFIVGFFLGIISAVLFFKKMMAKMGQNLNGGNMVNDIMDKMFGNQQDDDDEGLE